MKKLLLILLLLPCIKMIYGQEAPLEIVDSTYIWQRKSHFHVGTWEHPYHRTWYWLWYSRYEDEYNNNMTQWSPLNAYGLLKKEAKKKEQASTDTIASKKTDMFFDQIVDVAYLQEYNTLDTLKTNCQNSIDIYRYSGAPDCGYNSAILDDRFKTLLSNINTTNISTASSAEKREAYQEIEKDLVKLNAVVRKLIRANNILNRHNN